MESRKYSFVKLGIDENSQKNGNLMQTLEKLMPESVQMINLLEFARQKMYPVEKVDFFDFYSYENATSESLKLASSRNWEDESHPLLIVCKIKTKYSVNKNPNYTFRLLYSRETPSPENLDLVTEFSSLFESSWTTNFPLVFGTVSSRYHPLLNKVANLRDYSTTFYPNWTMYLDKNDTSLFDVSKCLPSDTILRPLISSEASLVNSHWKFGDEYKLVMLLNQILSSPSSGLYFQNESALGCWAITMVTGTINALHTLEPYRRKGYAALVMKDISRRLSLVNCYPLVEVEFESEASRALMDKLGFKLAFEAAWVYLTKNNP